MEVLKTAKTKQGNEIKLLGEKSGDNVLIIGVFHGEEPQGQFLIDEYLKTLAPLPSSKSKISVLPQGEDINFVKLSQHLRNNMTKEEVILWQHIRGKQINGLKFRRQQQIGKYICDFVCFEKRIVIEVDGSQHTDSLSDLSRDKFLNSQGFTILRFWNNEIKNNINGVLEKIFAISSCPPLVGGPKSLISRRGNSLLFIPCLNPDGMARGVRTNSNGVDLNRNFPTKNWELTEKNEFFGGEKPASEIETRFMIEVLEEYKPKLILTLHAPFKVVNYDGPAKEISEKISEIIGYPVEASIGYPTPGSFGTYCGVERNIPTITLELDETCPVKDLISPVHKIFDTLRNI